MKKLSDRAWIILQHIANRSKDGRKWLPGMGGSRGCDDYDEPTGTYLNIAGSGDAAILRSLVASGLLWRDAPDTDCSTQYNWLVATDLGRELLAANVDRVSSLQSEIIAKERRRIFDCLKRSGGYEESELREDFPEFYDQPQVDL